MVIWLDLDIIKIKPPKTGSNRIPEVKSKKCIYKNCPKPPKTGYQNADISKNPNIQLTVNSGDSSHRSHLNIVFPATKYTLSHINNTKPKNVFSSTFLLNP